jgi:hypothetical protein
MNIPPKIKTWWRKVLGSGRTDPPSGGSISNSMVNQRQINSNFNLNIKQDFGNDIQHGVFGGQRKVYDIRSNSISSNGSDLVIGGFSPYFKYSCTNNQ